MAKMNPPRPRLMASCCRMLMSARFAPCCSIATRTAIRLSNALNSKSQPLKHGGVVSEQCAEIVPEVEVREAPPTPVSAESLAQIRRMHRAGTNYHAE